MASLFEVFFPHLLDSNLQLDEDLAPAGADPRQQVPQLIAQVARTPGSAWFCLLLGEAMANGTAHGAGPAKRERIAAAEVRTLMARIPAPLREAAERVVVVLERRPSADMAAEGIEPDTMGVFEGDDLAESEDGPRRIVLFLDNIWDEAEGKLTAFRREVRATLLHELGHYLGLTEADLEEREL